MGTTHRAVDLDPAHEEATVFLRLYVTLIERRPEAGPAAARIVLGVGREERRVASHATINALFLIVVVLTAKRPLRTLHPRNTILLRGELVLPLFFRLLYLPWRISHKQILARCALRPPLLSTLRLAPSLVTAGFSERDPHRMMHMRGLLKRFVRLAEVAPSCR